MKSLILNGIAGTLNACGKAVVFSYDFFSSGMGKMCDVAKKAPGAIKNFFKVSWTEVATKKSAPEAFSKKARLKKISSKVKEVLKPSRPTDIKLINEENFKLAGF